MRRYGILRRTKLRVSQVKRQKRWKLKHCVHDGKAKVDRKNKKRVQRGLRDKPTREMKQGKKLS